MILSIQIQISIFHLHIRLSASTPLKIYIPNGVLIVSPHISHWMRPAPYFTLLSIILPHYLTYYLTYTFLILSNTHRESILMEQYSNNNNYFEKWMTSLSIISNNVAPGPVPA